jgi:hypothetical protein
MAEMAPLSLVTLEGGAVVEMFDRALEKVAANLADINTGLGAREIQLVVKAKPSRDRSMVEWTAEVKPPKLAGQDPVGGTALIDREGDRPTLLGRKPAQTEIPFTIIKEGGAK